MKKSIIFLALCAAALSGCAAKNPSVSTPAAPSAPAFEPTQAQICGTMCERIIPELCKSEIEDYTASGQSLDESIMEPLSCQLMCEAEWDEKTVACVTDADECAQLSSSAPYCDDMAEDDDSAAVDKKTAVSCDKACRNYVVCASYGDNISQADLNDAYASCLEICGTWTAEQRSCMSRTAINRPSDCAAQTACILPAVREMMR